MRHLRLPFAITVGFLALLVAAPAWACGGLINTNGSVTLVRTTTLAAYHEGIEHYVTSFQFAGGEGEFGSIIPLPGVPTKVIRGGDWTLQRLVQETQPQPEALAFAAAATGAVLVVVTLNDFHSLQSLPSNACTERVSLPAACPPWKVRVARSAAFTVMTVLAA